MNNSRRDFIQGAMSSPFLVLRSKSFVEIPQKYPTPKFAIGNQILSLWTDEYGDVDESLPPEFGEIMGICWNPRNEQWEYVINWTGGDSTAGTYPVFDEVLIDEISLRLVSHA